MPGLVRAPAGVPLFQRFPRHVVVVGRRGKPGPTAFEAARAAAERELGRTLDVRSIVLGSSGVVVAPADDVVLRVSVGPAASRVEEQRAALESLRAARPSAFVAERVPWVLASGSVGLAVWSLERRLRGAPATEVEQGVLGDCLDFLCELFAAHVDGARPASPRLDAEVCALHFPEHAETLYELGRRLEGALESVPRGFGHGDFWAGNLLVEDGRLAGVVDWPSAGPGRLPLLDLMHLRVNEVRERTRAPLAAVVAEHLLPLAGSGGHDLDREYCRRLGLDLAGSDLEGLVGAYWLEALRHDLVDPDRDPAAPARPEWRNANLEVLSVLARRFGIRTGSQ